MLGFIKIFFSLPQLSLLQSRLTPGPRKSLTKTVLLSLKNEIKHFKGKDIVQNSLHLFTPNP